MVNPTGGNNQGPWGVGSNQDDAQGAQGSQRSGNVGDHSLSSSSSGKSGGLARRIADFFSSLFGGGSTAARRSSTSSSASLTPRRPAPPPPTSSGASGGPSPLARPPIKRPAPQPPTGGPAPKRPAPQPPTGGASGGPSPLARPPIKRPAPQPPTGGPAPKRPAPQPPTGDKGLVGGLKKAVSEHEAARVAGRPGKQSSLDKLSKQLTDQWTSYETTDPIGYKLMGLEVLSKSLEASRNEQLFLTEEAVQLPKEFGSAKDAGISLMQSGLKNILNPGPVAESSSALLKTMLSVTLEGPHLEPRESIEAMVRTRIEDFNVNDDPDPAQGRMPELLDFARQLDNMRTTSPRAMPRMWAQLSLQLGTQLRSYGNSVKAANRGGYDSDRIGIEARDCLNALKLMSEMNSSVSLNALNILANDVIAGRDE